MDRWLVHTILYGIRGPYGPLDLAAVSVTYDQRGPLFDGFIITRFVAFSGRCGPYGCDHPCAYGRAPSIHSVPR